MDIFLTNHPCPFFMFLFVGICNRNALSIRIFNPTIMARRTWRKEVRTLFDKPPLPLLWKRRGEVSALEKGGELATKTSHILVTSSGETTLTLPKGGETVTSLEKGDEGIKWQEETRG